MLNRWRIAPSRALAIAFVAQLLQYGSGLLLLPFMVTRLSPAEVGIWYIFITVQGLAMIADFGFQPTLARQFAMAVAGARTLEAKGIGDSVAGDPNFELISRLFGAARALYLALAAAILVALLTIGLFYIRGLAASGGLDVDRVSRAWSVFALAIALGIYLLWVSPILIGFGRIEPNYLFLAALRGSSALLGIGTLLAGGGLLGLALAWVAGAIAAAILGLWLIRPIRARLVIAPAEPGSARAVLRAILPNAGRMGLVGLASFLILRFSIFAVSTFLGLPAAGSFAISAQILTGVAAIAGLPMTMSLPRLVAARIGRDRAGLRAMIVENAALYLGAFVIGAAIVVFGGDPALRAIGSRVVLLPQAVLALLALVTLLEGFHSNAAFAITTGNDVPFLGAAIWSGLAVAAGVTVIAASGGGVAAVIACQGAVQLAYNNWKWPLVLWRQVRA